MSHLNLPKRIHQRPKEEPNVGFKMKISLNKEIEKSIITFWKAQSIMGKSLRIYNHEYFK